MYSQCKKVIAGCCHRQISQRDQKDGNRCHHFVVLFVHFRLKNGYVSRTSTKVNNCIDLFLQLDVMLAQYMQHAVIVCPSVCLTVCLLHAGIVPKRLSLVTQIAPYDSPWTLVFSCHRCRRNSNGVTPNGGAK